MRLDAEGDNPRATLPRTLEPPIRDSSVLCAKCGSLCLRNSRKGLLHTLNFTASRGTGRHDRLQQMLEVSSLKWPLPAYKLEL